MYTMYATFLNDGRLARLSLLLLLFVFAACSPQVDRPSSVEVFDDTGASLGSVALAASSMRASL